jgi:arylformamidase
MSTANPDHEYEIDSKIPDRDEIQAHYAARSAEVVARHADASLDIAYGPDVRQRLDIFAAGGSDLPAILFFHGGYWTGGSKESRRFPAPAWNQRGITWVPVEYRLTPAATLDDIVADVRQAVAWFHANASRYGCNPAAIHVCGNSAGGHIAGMLAAAGWQARLSLPDDVVKSATAISGLFDLAPLRETFINKWLALDVDGARRNSPIDLPPRAGLPIILSWGGLESRSFHRQSLKYAEMCRGAGADVTIADRPKANHLSIIAELEEPESPLFATIADKIIGGANRL